MFKTRQEELQTAIDAATQKETDFARRLANAKTEHENNPPAAVDTYLKYGRFYQEIISRAQQTRQNAENELLALQGQSSKNLGQLSHVYKNL